MAHPFLPQHDLLTALRTMSVSELEQEVILPSRLVLGCDPSHNLVEVWAPFDHVTLTARLAIVGLTPGRHQMGEALRTARTALLRGTSETDALTAAKVHASFSGPMRTNLVALLDGIGMAERLGLRSAASLWGEASHLAHFTSALRYPVFCAGANWSGGNPGPLAVPMLRARVEATLTAELASLPSDTLVVPLGPKAVEAALHAAKRARIDPARVLSGLPHPSGANAERVAVFLGRKRPEDSSRQTNAGALIAARARLTEQVRAA